MARQYSSLHNIFFYHSAKLYPHNSYNTHTIFVESDSAKFTMTMQNIPSENPRTGRITSQSVVAMLRKMTSHFSIGT